METLSTEEVKMGKIKIEDLPQDIEMTDNELKKVFGGALALNRNMGTTLSRRIFLRPVLMEKNDAEETMFF